MSIAENLERVRNEVADACARSGRDAGTVALMAVSKVHPAEAILEAHAAGQWLFGENRVQEMQSKFAAVSGLPDIELHLIGPLQNNKTAKAAEIFDAVDTLDSAKTAERLNTAAAALGKVLPVLIEVKSNRAQSLSFQPGYLKKLTNYAELLKLPLLIAWKHHSVWSLFEARHLKKAATNFTHQSVI